ncbi:hypothetical protein GHT09_008386 [Marmota monax]|uniref:NUCB1-like N-terminal domain-containing protein n=1 Tax=Marmota monax TaxID=9995 RepID=A0A834QPD9_MARMO|nr:hypothetical protein GHT09_008386 [Marmota monax]
MPPTWPHGVLFLLPPLLLLLRAVLAVPLERGVPEKESPATESPDTGLYYHRYLQEVINVLETDGHFREKLQAANAEDIKSGKLSRELDFVSHHVRTKLDELKRQEVSRLRMLLKAKMDAEQETNINSDGVLDEQELEALFTKELEKVYDPKNEEDDMREMEEERLRMREHVMKNVDTNQDRLVTLEEFLVSTQRKEYGDTGEGWETVEMHPAYTEEELRRFEEELAAREAELNAKAQRLSQETEALGRSQGRLEAQKRELQQAVLHMEQRKQEQEARNTPPANPEGELKFHPDTGDVPVPAPAGDQKDVDTSEKKIPEQPPEVPQLDSQHL